MKFLVEWIETEERKSDNSHYNWSQNDRNCWNDVFTLFLIEFRIFITQCGNKFSEDDDVVPTEHAKKYADKLKKARIFIFKNKKGHFQVAKFPEIVKMIKAL